MGSDSREWFPEDQGDQLREEFRVIDLHAHLLPGLDDGAKTMEEALQMCGMSYRDGVRTLVATPHTLNGLYLNERETILSKVRELNEALAQCGLGMGDCGSRESNSGMELSYVHSEFRILNSEFRILPGADVHLCEKTLSHLDEGKLMTVGDGKKCLFIEFPSQAIPFGSEEVLFQLMKRGILPIITHPERNQEIWQRPQRYYEMIRMGCLGQVTAMSLTGGFGPKVRRVAEKLMNHRLIHFIASDAHSPDGRPPLLSDGVRAAEKTVGREMARKMVEEYPQAILDGLKPNVPQPVRI
jgi:protein-tyrosine phosphatase